MNVLWFSFSLITAAPWHQSLRALGHNLDLRFYYDKVSFPNGLLPIPPDRAIPASIRRASSKDAEEGKSIFRTMIP